MVSKTRKINVKFKGTVQRCAFTLIELIFAIVVIGITMLALPTIMLQDANSQEKSLFQEGIMLTTTKASQVLTFPWDPLSSPAGGLMSLSQVLETGVAGDSELTARRAAPEDDFRVGHFPEQLRRRLTPSSDQRIANAIAASPIPSMNNFNGESVEINATAGQEQWAYKKRWRLSTTVSYISDATVYTDENITFNFSDVFNAAAPVSNIKMIQVTATDITPNSTADQVRLTSYSSNIGETEFYKRRY
jgi:prepilin-type N-terminal cleavage/methylation domain-containing protein